MIWYHIGTKHKTQSLEIALQAECVTAAMLSYMSSWDYPPDKLEKEIELVNASGKKLIWMRMLWPMYPSLWTKRFNDKRDYDSTALCDVAFISRQITELIKEAKDIGNCATALDFEAYAHAKTRAGKYLGGHPVRLELLDERILAANISQLLYWKKVVDYCLPAGSLRSWHPYHKLAELARCRISEKTYEDDVEPPDFPHEGRAYYMDIETGVHRYQPNQLDLIRQRAGTKEIMLFVYNNAEEVAKELERASRRSI